MSTNTTSTNPLSRTTPNSLLPTTFETLHEGPEEAESDTENDNDNDNNDDSQPMLPTSILSSFDSITSPSHSNAYISSTPKQLLCSIVPSPDCRRSCCLLNGFKCNRLGSSRICNKYIYNKNKGCITGPHFPATVVMIGFITGCAYFFAIFLPNIGTTLRFGPKTDRKSLFTLQSFVMLVFYSLTIALLLMTSCVDPGILTGPKSLPAHIANGDEAVYREWRFCDKCEVFQPPGAGHCSDCKVCIAELDHHCPWMGKCVGKGNMKWFKLFNVCWILFFIYALVSMGW